MIAHIVSIWTYTLTRFLASCILGSAVWLFLRTNYDHTIALHIPINTHNTPQSHNVLQESLRITISGPWKDLCHFINQHPSVKINPTSHARGLQEATITHDQLNLPATLHVDSYPTVLLFVNPSS